MSTDIVGTSSAMVPFGTELRCAAQLELFGVKCFFPERGELLHFVARRLIARRHRRLSRRSPDLQLLSIKARTIIDWGAHDVSDAPPAKRCAAAQGWKSLIRDEWEILDASDQPIGRIREDSQLLAVLRRFLSNLIPQDYHVEVNGEQVGQLRGTWNPFVVKYQVGWSDKADALLDPRMRIAASVLLMTIEGKQN
jgi:hypothetical protein